MYFLLFIKSLDNYLEIFMTWNNKIYLINSYIMILQYSGIKGLLMLFNCCSSVLLTTNLKSHTKTQVILIKRSTMC